MILIDWLSFTLKNKELIEVVEKVLQLDISDFTRLESGKMGYKERILYNNIEVLFEGKEDMGIHAILTGQGCRFYESNNDIKNLITRINFLKGKVKRLDIALDLINYEYDILELISESIKNNLVISKWRANTILEKRETNTAKKIGKTVSFGSRTSDIYLRIYDKKNQAKIECKRYVRLEIEVKGKRAEVLQDEILKDEAGLIFYKILNNYIRFVEKGTCSNKSRWKTAFWWSDLMKTLESIKLTSQPKKRTIEEMENWLEKQISTTLATIAIAKYGDIDFMYNLIDEGKKKLKNKHYEVIRGYQSNV